MEESFHIQLAKAKKANKIGSDIANFGLFFSIIFFLFLFPANYLPSEVATIYLIEFVNRNVYLFLSISILIYLFGEWLKGLRKYEKAQLELTVNEILISSKTKDIKLTLSEIKKVKGIMNLVHGLTNIRKLNFIIKMSDNKTYEIRSHKHVFNGLTDYFYNKVKT